MAEDTKFKFEDGYFVNRVSGEKIPQDEPVILFRARDRYALDVLKFYEEMVSVEGDLHHRAAIIAKIGEFRFFKNNHPDRMKEPGITRDIVLKDPVAGS